mmetsp:Transcript_16187/g.41907  ORF Transcript_16187/g.41907 Transcript_16187/m.41907 type:complete len:82 (+) Transcript_16187:422-667(+)
MASFLLQVVNPWSKFQEHSKRVKGSEAAKDYNFKGDGFLHGGTMVVQPKGAGIAYQFAEESIGSAAPVDDVVAAVEVASRL